MTTMHEALGAAAAAVDATAKRADREGVLDRMRRGDYTLWKPQPTEITNRLGWLTIADRMGDALPDIHRVVGEVRGAGYTHALLLGMGGSSLAPEVFRKTFGVAAGFLDLAVLDSTDPGAVAAHARSLDPARTLFIVSTKSGGTVETFSFFRFFYRWTVRALGQAAAGVHFIAITDPGSALADTAKRYLFRATFLADPNIGGRYSALSHFGLVPASLIGVDVRRLLDRAHTAERSSADAIRLGAILGECAVQGRDKVTFILSPAIAPYGAWVEQLLAESTGKEGKGIVPIADEPVGAPTVYGSDRVFVHIRLAGDDSADGAVDALRAAGHPVVRIDLADPYDLGGQFVTWETATAVAGWRMGINPFDQPNVEAAKVLARKMVAAYESSGALPSLTPTARGDGLTVYASNTPKEQGSAADAIRTFLGQARAGDYIAIQAYVEPTPATTAALESLRVTLRDRLRLATTVGYGPRFLHSTGQLHKGDGGHGVFLQLVTTPSREADLPIPDTADADTSHITFGVLKTAQALGDRQALLDGGRRILRVDPNRAPEDIARLRDLVP